MIISSLSCEKDMMKFAKNMLKQGYRRFLLEGPLGSGKTTFVKCFLELLGYPQKEVKSPTFTYFSIYKINKSCQVFHGDFYKIDTHEQFFSTGIFDNIVQYEYTFVEWPKFCDLYKKSHEHWIYLKIDIVDKTKRRLTRSST